MSRHNAGPQWRVQDGAQSGRADDAVPRDLNGAQQESMAGIGQDNAGGVGLEVDAVTVRYPGDKRTSAVEAVSNATLRVPHGSTVALLGPSGCGKSTLLRAVAGLEPLAAGSIRFDGQDLADVPVHRREFGLVFQDGQLFAHKDVAGNIEYGLRTHHVPRAERAERVAELLQLVGLEGYEARSVTTLSGGQRQRIALARALAPRPRLLLLDEPLSALDRDLRERLSVDLAQILAETATTALYVTHDLHEADTVADRVITMRAGELVPDGEPGSFLSSGA